ncbi:ead/Ea22-like family protein [Pseudomonas aeruginosa]|uniref:ead/Ea22-like family protein n=1 Tax=Pseudomonas aeruginosa TaxID=287 RepID=UPI00287F9870|nr:ead/Ea22-like family protein [Pseudomonas aeruginosa]HCE8379565.1 ead/Ea22-like family protein [Pseudomonas aeruginosa]
MDTNKLKELAEKLAPAYQQPWESHRHSASAVTVGAVGEDGEYSDFIDVRISDYSAFDEHDDELGQWIAAATPKTVLALLDDIDRLKAENEELRQIVSGCATACGAGCSPECTLDFMSMLPDEIASVVGRRARNAAIGSVVWQFIDRMTDVCEQDPADRILEQFVAAVRPAIDAAIEGAKQ